MELGGNALKLGTLGTSYYHQIVRSALERWMSRSVNQRDSLNQRGRSDDEIQWIFGIIGWKLDGARKCAASNWQDNKTGFNFPQKRLKADTEAEPTCLPGSPIPSE
jgi:hypothetical protein